MRNAAKDGNRFSIGRNIARVIAPGQPRGPGFLTAVCERLDVSPLILCHLLDPSRHRSPNAAKFSGPSNLADGHDVFKFSSRDVLCLLSSLVSSSLHLFDPSHPSLSADRAWKRY